MKTIKSVRHKIKKTIRFFLDYFIWFFNRPHLPVNENGKTLLHIGCGDIVIPGFINIDARPLPHVHFLTHELFNLNRFKTSSIDFVYMCHVLEHIHIPQISVVLKELFRVLKIGGVLRFSVPDFDLILAMYHQCNQQIESVELVLMGGQDYRFNDHHSVFNKQYLKKCLVESGFCEVRDWDPLTAEHRGFSDWASTGVPFQGRFFPISLNLEAEK